MDLKNYSTGVQHIGIPTNDIDKTVEFYHKLGFETAFETVNEEANEKVVFLKLGTLVVETYENHAAKMEHGAIMDIVYPQLQGTDWKVWRNWSRRNRI